MALRLPAELVALIHNVELNRRGWWERGLHGLIVAALARSASPLSLDELRSQIARDFQCGVAPELVAEHVEKLCVSGRVICLDQGLYKLGESDRRDYAAQIAEGEAIYDQARLRFEELANQVGLQIDRSEAWESFNTEFLIPYIKETGANTYRLFGGGELTFEGGDFGRFLAHYPETERPLLRTLAAAFLSPAEEAARRYVLRLLTSFLVIAASGISSAALAAVTETTPKRPEFRIVLDTNVLFSIFGLHENPADDASLALDRLAKMVEGKVDAKPLVLPTTVDEVRRVLGTVSKELGKMIATPAVARAALMSPSHGIPRRYLEEVSKGVTVTTEDYLRPYLDDLAEVLKSKRITVVNEPVERFRSTEGYREDLKQQFEAGWREPLGLKGYQQLDHDLLLWHVVRSKRPEGVDAPALARYWVATLDYRLLMFDRSKRHERGERLPLCLHPASMVQVLQFWIPRSAEFDAILMNSLRTPIITAEFDRDAEAMTIRILRALSRYEIGDLSEEVIRATFFNEALRAKLQTSRDEESDAEIVREAALQRLAAMESDLAAAQLAVLASQGLVQKSDVRLADANERAMKAESEVNALRLLLKSETERHERDAHVVRCEVQEQLARSARRLGSFARKATFVLGSAIILGASAIAGKPAAALTGLSWPVAAVLSLVTLVGLLFGVLNQIIGVSVRTLAQSVGQWTEQKYLAFENRRLLPTRPALGCSGENEANGDWVGGRSWKMEHSVQPLFIRRSSRQLAILQD